MSLIRIEDIAHVRFSAPDLTKMRGFLDDFGLASSEVDGRLYARGTDGRSFVHVTEKGNAAFLALGLRARDLADLKMLATAEGTEVEDLREPGGGKVVRLRDPDGFLVEVVAGQARLEPQLQLPEQPRNSVSRHRRLRTLVRLTPSPAHVHRIGHCVLNVSDFRQSEAWYKARFGFLTSDEVEAAPNVALGAFMRCDLGDRPADHHTVFLAQLPQKPGFLHAAFEVANFDDLMLGHQHLKARKRSSAWGVGRHIMGSQIFDYWNDPWGHELEHWTDGDLLTADDPPNKMTMQDLLSVQWGSPHPMFVRKAAPSPGVIAFVTALNLRIRRLFRRNLKVQSV